MSKDDLRVMSVGFLIGITICIGGVLGLYILSSFLSVPRIIAIVIVVLTVAAACFVYFIPANPNAPKLTVKQVFIHTLKGLGVIA